MAIQILFDVNQNPIEPTIILTNRNGNKVGAINGIFGMNVSDAFSEIPIVSFKVSKTVNDVINPMWDEITDLRLIWAKEWDMWFEISVELSDSDDTIKSVTGTALCESELSQIELFDYQINTEQDIARDDYLTPTVLYNPDIPEASLLHRILEKAPHYTIDHVDSSIQNIQRTFTFDKTSIKGALDEICTEIGCIVIYGNGSGTDEIYGDVPERTISLYDLFNVCENCGYRGEFEGICPECGNANIIPGYGKDTTIFITKDNLTEEVVLSTNTSNVKNCFRLVGGDDLMTATIRNCNPNGSQYLWYISDETRADMIVGKTGETNLIANTSDQLVSEEGSPLLNQYVDNLAEKLSEYNSDYVYYQKEYPIKYTDSLLSKYNQLISKYSPSKRDLTPLSNFNLGYPSLMNDIYNIIDFDLYLEHSMMPIVATSDTNAVLEAQKLTHESMSPCPVSNYDVISESTVNDNVKSYASLLVMSHYKVDIVNSTFDKNTHIWTGSLSVTNYSDDTDTATTGVFEILIVDDYKRLVKLRLERVLKQKNTDTLDIESLFNKTLSAFKTELKKYALVPLETFRDAGQACLDILIEEGISDFNTWGDHDPNLYEEFYVNYLNKVAAITEEISVRDGEIAIVDAIDEEAERLKIQIQSELNLENFLGDRLWKQFCAYRRESEFSNSNYISDGLSNAELFERANDFIALAQREIYKSANLQHSISSTLKNLLVIPQFSPLVDNFTVGNWIRIEVDGVIYKLRLLKYEVNFDDLSQISVEFSDVVKLIDGTSDVHNVLAKASTMASTYEYTQRQSFKGAKANAELIDWTTRGLNATNIKIINSAENQNMIFDDHGMLFRSYDYATAAYEPTQLKIINSTLAITDDAWNSTKTAVGKFSYVNPATNQLETAYGINGEVIVGKLLLGEALGIYNSGGTLKFDENGFVVTNGDNTVVINPNDETSIFQLLNGNNAVAKFDENGNLVITGAINATALNLINTKISSDDIDGLANVATSGRYNDLLDAPKSLSDLEDDIGIITTDDIKVEETVDQITGIKTTVTTVGENRYTTYTSSDGKYILTDLGIVKDPLDDTKGYFLVSKDGLLTAKNALIYGTVYATNGSFTGDITANTLTLGSNVKINTNHINGLATVATSGNYTDLLNAPTIPESISDLTDDVGILTTDDVVVSETIDSNTGIKTTITTVGEHQYTTYTSPDGKYLLTNIGVGHNTADASQSYFLVDTDGLLTAKNAIIWGTIYATDGRFSGEVSAQTLYVGHQGATHLIADEDSSLIAGTNNNLVVDIFGYDYIYFDGTHIYMNTDNFSIGKNGNVTIRGDVTATSFNLASGVTVPSDKVSGLAEIAKSGDYDDLINAPVLAPIATSGKWEDIDEKPTNILYTDDITVEETIDEETGIKTTVTTVGENVYTTYTSEDGKYILTDLGLGQDSQDGSKSYFMVSTDGLLTAKNALIYGTVYATAGRFTGDITANSLTLGTNVYIPSTKVNGLSSVATSGSYNDLSGKPTLSAVATSGNYSDLNNLPTFARVATTGSYNDLTGKPTNLLTTDDVEITETTNPTTGVKTTITKVGSNTYTTYTSPDGSYLLTNIGLGTDTETGASSYFKVATDGLLTAKNAIIWGTIYATNGRFSGEVSADTLYVGLNNTGNIASSQGNLVVGTNTGLISSVYNNDYIYFDGTHIYIHTSNFNITKNGDVSLTGDLTAKTLYVGSKSSGSYLQYDGQKLDMAVSSLSIGGFGAATESYVGEVADGLSSDIEDAMTAAGNAASSAEDAKKVATNYLYYDSTNGLVITQNHPISELYPISYLTDGNLRLTGTGVYIYNGTSKLAEFTGNNLKFFYFTNQAMVLNSTGLTFYKPDGTTIAAQISTTDGLKVSNGVVGGFTVTNSAMTYSYTPTGSSDSYEFKLAPGGFSKVIDGISRFIQMSVGNYFGIGYDGSLYCTNAVMGGTIHATAGYFGSSSNTSQRVYIDNNGTLYIGNKFWISSDGSNNIQSSAIGYGSSNAPQIDVVTTATSACIKYGMTSLLDTTHDGFYLGVDGLAIGSGNFVATASGSVTAKGTIVANEFQITKDNDYTSGKPTTFIKAEYLYDSTNAYVRIGQNVKHGAYISLYYASSDWTDGQLVDAGKIKISAPTGLEIVNDTSMFIDGGILINDETNSSGDYNSLDTPEAYVKRRLYMGHIDENNSNNDIYGIIDVTSAKSSRLVIAGLNGVNSLGDLQAFDFISSNAYRIRYTEVTNPGTSSQSENENALVNCIEAIDKPSGITYTGSGSANQFLKIGSSASSYSCIAMPIKGDNIFVRLKNGSSFVWYDLQYCLEKAKNASSGGGTTYTFTNGLSLSGTTVSNSGVRSISSGSTYGAISVNTGGTTSSVSVYGLGSAAYSDDNDFATAAHNHIYASGTVSGGATKSDILIGTSDSNFYMLLTWNNSNDYSSGKAGNLRGLYILRGGTTAKFDIISGSGVTVTNNSSSTGYISIKNNLSGSTLNYYLIKIK